nr:glucosaminidase domain-containing protein [uncultured Porphyromonas sp.]
MRISHSICRSCIGIFALLLLCVVGASAQVLRKPTFMDYIRTYQAEARRQMDRHAIPASITLAQGLIETGAGTSTLAREHNNHFGIKCHSTWSGRRTYRRDDNPNDCFRSYPSVKDSYDDHSLFLKARRYQRLFALRYDDYRGWAMGLQLCGYATNKGYANMLIKVIEDYELYTFDHGEYPTWYSGGGSAPRRSKSSRSSYDGPQRPSYLSYGLLYVLADQNDTYERIAADMGISAKKLAKYNDTPEDFPLNEGDIVYLEPKNKEASPRYSTYTVRIGDSMHDIAQRYGIRLDRLYKLNDKDGDYVPEEGDILRLR